MSELPDDGRDGRSQVPVLGGGFAGIGAVRKLKGAEVDVVLVDRHGYHTFQPLQYQLATGLPEQTAVGHSLCDLVHGQENATVRQATVTAVDLDAREVQFAELAPMASDYLVLALGAEVDFFGTEGAAEHAFPMYTLPDAVRLKDHVLRKWEDADRNPDLVDDGALTRLHREGVGQADGGGRRGRGGRVGLSDSGHAHVGRGARRAHAMRRSRSGTKDKGTMATIGRGAAVVQMLGGRTMKGKVA